MIQRPTYVRYTLSPEAELRRVARNKAQSERLKQERAEARAAKGLPPKGSMTAADRKEQMKIYMRGVREQKRIENADAIAAHKLAKAYKKAEKARIAQDIRNAKAREKRIADRSAGRPDLRVNNGRKPLNGIKRKYLLKLKGKANMKPVTIKQQKQIPTRKVDLSVCTKIRIDSKTEVFVKPGQDPEQVRQKYLSLMVKL